MRKGWKKVIVGLTVTILPLSMTMVSMASSIQQAESELNDLEKEKQEIEQKIKELEKEKGNITQYISKLDTELADLNSEIDNLTDDIGRTEDLLTKTQQELEDAKVQQVSQYDTMKARIKYMYENGSDDYMTMLFESSSITDLLNRAEYVNRISQYDQGLYTRFNATRVSIEEKEATIASNLEKLNVMQQKLELEKESVNTLLDNKTKELQKYTSNINSAEAEVQEFNAEIAKQEEYIEQLLEAERKRVEEEERKRKEEEERKRKEEEEKKKQEALQQQQQQNNSSSGSSSNDTSNSSQTTSSSYRWPLKVSGRITSYFGNRNSPTAGASSYHKGIDVGAPTGTEIVAANSGTVTTAGYSSAMGNYVMVYHGNSTFTVYMHCNSLKVSKGQQVSKGQTIATVGSTGISTGPHLHFGISVNGTYVDPLKYVSQP